MFQAEPALVYDSVQVFAHGLAELDGSHVLRPANLSCDKEKPWDDGLSLYNYISAVSVPIFIHFFQLLTLELPTGQICPILKLKSS